MPFADSTELSQWEVVAASVFAIPLLQSNDPQFTDLQHSIYWLSNTDSKHLKNLNHLAAKNITRQKVAQG